MKPKTVSFILVTLSLGFTAFALSQVPFGEPVPEPVHLSQSRTNAVRHFAARARNGSTQKSTTTAQAATDGGAIWDPIGTGNHGLDNGLDGGEGGAGTSGDQTNIPHR